MPPGITRLNRTNHLPKDNAQNEVIKSLKISSLIDGTIDVTAFESQFLQVYERLPSPKRFEKLLADALLSIPFSTPHTYYVLSELLLEICNRQHILLLPSILRQNIFSKFAAPNFDDELNFHLQKCLQLVIEGRADLKKLVELVDYQYESLEPELIRFIIEALKLDLIATLRTQDRGQQGIKDYLRKLAEGFPSPAPFEAELTKAILSVPLFTAHSFYVLAEVVIHLCLQENHPFNPSNVLEKVSSTWPLPVLDEDEHLLLEASLSLVKEGKLSLKLLLDLLNHQHQCLSEKLYALIFETLKDHPSKDLTNTLINKLFLCPHPLKSKFRQLPLTAQQKKRLHADAIHGLWLDIQSFFGASILKDLFAKKRWEMIRELPQKHVPELIRKCLSHQLHTRYPLAWAQSIKQSPFNADYPLLIECIFTFKAYSALVPLIALNRPTLLAVIDEKTNALTPEEHSQFCLDALLNAPRSFAEPHLVQFVQRTSTIPELSKTDSVLWRSHPYLFVAILTRALELSKEPLCFQLSDEQRNRLENATAKEQEALYHLLKDSRLSRTTQRAMLALLLPNIPQNRVDQWYDLLDEKMQKGKLPPLFQKEHTIRSQMSVSQRINRLTAPDDELLGFKDAERVLFAHVFLEGDLKLQLWLLEKGHLTQREYAALTFDVCRKMSIEESTARLNEFILGRATLDDIETICSHPELILTEHTLAVISQRLAEAPAEVPFRTKLLNRFLLGNAALFPWPYFFSLLQSDPDAFRGEIPSVILMLLPTDVIPSIVLDLCMNALDNKPSPKILVALFEFITALNKPEYTRISHSILNLFLMDHPQSLAEINQAYLWIYLEDTIFSEMPASSFTIVGRLLAHITDQSTIKKYAPRYCRLLILRIFGHEAFGRWAQTQLRELEAAWIDVSFDSTHQAIDDSKKRYVPDGKSIQISFNRNDIQARIQEEQQLSVRNFTPNVQNSFSTIIRSSSPLEFLSEPILQWSLHPDRNRELLLTFIHELCHWKPLNPFVVSYKNAYARSLIRSLLRSGKDINGERILDMLYLAHIVNSLPMHSVTALELQGFNLLALAVSNQIRDPLENILHLQCVNLLASGTVYKDKGELQNAITKAALKKILFLLLDGKSLYQTQVAIKILVSNRDSLGDEFRPLFDKCKSQEEELIPESLENLFICGTVLSTYPDLLLHTVKLVLEDKISERGLTNLSVCADRSYQNLWKARQFDSVEKRQEWIVTDASLLNTLSRVNRNQTPPVGSDPLCALWAKETLALCGSSFVDSPTRSNHYLKIGRAILIMFSLYEDYFNRHTATFMQLWIKTRLLFRAAANSSDPQIQIAKHQELNRMTARFAPLILRQFDDFVTYCKDEFQWFRSHGCSPQSLGDLQGHFIQSYLQSPHDDERIALFIKATQEI